jgi:hypothetical protein
MTRHRAAQLLFALALAGAELQGQPGRDRYDLVIAGGSVLDGTGRAAQQLDDIVPDAPV